jgi:hypothetical protein
MDRQAVDRRLEGENRVRNGRLTATPRGSRYAHAVTTSEDPKPTSLVEPEAEPASTDRAVETADTAALAAPATTGNPTGQPPLLERGARAKPAGATQVVTLPTLSTQPVTLEKGLAILHGTPILPAHHPNLGLAPIDMKSGFSGAAGRVRRDSSGIAARGLEAAVQADPSLRARYDDMGLRHLLRDGELLVERLAMCLGSDDVRWLAQYAEWVGPSYRRRQVPLADLATLCAGIREAIAPDLTADELACADRALDAAAVVLQRNGRVAGDRHKRRAIFKWMYRGV